MEVLLNTVKQAERKIICVAAAGDEDTLKSVKMANEQGIADFVLVGDKAKISTIAGDIGMPAGNEVIDAPDEASALECAVSRVVEKKAQILMKGMVNTSDFLKAVLRSELRASRLLSHFAAYEMPGDGRLIFHADTGINAAPDLDEKEQIMLNSVGAMNALGIKCPKIAVLAANEKVSSKIQATVDAHELAERAKKGKYPPMVLEGPIAMDVALSPKAAEHKNIRSEISGAVDLFLLPNIETGNIMGKALLHYVDMKMAGVVLGAACPIVLTSRAESPEGKLYSIALACLLADKNV